MSHHDINLPDVGTVLFNDFALNLTWILWVAL